MRFDDPAKPRIAWGTTSPMKPIRPLTATAAAAASEAVTSTISRMRSGRRPSVRASSSPTAIASSIGANHNSTAVVTTAYGTSTRTSLHPAVVRLPRIHE